MLSKATSLCWLSLRASPKLPFAKLAPACYGQFRNSNITTSSLYNKTPYNFFSSINENQNETNIAKSSKRAPAKAQEQEQKEDDKEDFIDFMQKDNSKTGAVYQYSNKTVFEVHTQKDDFTKKYMFYWGMSTVWGVVSYLTFNYINPWVAIIPVWFLTGSLLTMRMASKFAKGMVKKLEIVDDKHIKIYPLSLKGKEVLCEIANTEVLGIKVMQETSTDKGASTIKSYIIMANFVEATKKKTYNNMRLIVDPAITSIESIDLLKSILYGQVAEVEKFEYVDRTEDKKKAEEDLKVKKERDEFENAEGNAKFEFKEEEFDELRRQLNRNPNEEKKE